MHDFVRNVDTRVYTEHPATPQQTVKKRTEIYKHNDGTPVLTRLFYIHADGTEDMVVTFLNDGTTIYTLIP